MKNRAIDEVSKKDWNKLIPYKPNQKVYIVERIVESHEVTRYETEYHGVDCWGSPSYETIIDSIVYKVKEITFNLEFHLRNRNKIYTSREEAEHYAYVKNNYEYYKNERSDCTVHRKLGKTFYYVENNEIKSCTPMTDFEYEELIVMKKGRVFKDEISIKGIVEDYGWDNSWLRWW